MAVILTTSWQNVAYKTWEPGTGFKVAFGLDARYSSQDVNSNYSIIETRLNCDVQVGSGGGYNYSFSLSYGSPVEGSGYWNLEDETIIQGSGVVYHETDGTKSLTLNANAIITGISMYVGLSADVILPTIPRASNIAKQTLNIGQAKTISWTRASSNFTHTLRYSFGSVSNQNIGTGLATSVSWTPPTSLYQYIPNAKQGTGTLNLITYNGNTNIGNKSSTLTLKTVETDCNPVINSVSYQDVNPTTTNITSDSSYIVAGQSTLRVNVSFSTRLYSTLKSITINGVDYTSLAVAGTTSDGTTPYTLQKDITNYIGNKITVIVTDTRTYSKTNETTIAHYIDYVPLSGSFTMRRTQPTNGEIGISFSGDYFNSSFKNTANTLTIRYRYKKSNEENYSNYITISASDYHKVGNKYYSGSTTSSTEAEEISLGSSFDYREDYDFEIEYKDKLITLTKTMSVQKGIPIVNWNKTKFRVNGNLEVEGNATIDGILTVGGNILDTGKLLWTNSNPSSGFASQTITLNTDDFDIYEIYYYISITSSQILTCKSLKGYGTRLMIPSSNMEYRPVTANSDTSYTFGVPSSNNYAVPIYIIGYKSELFY